MAKLNDLDVDAYLKSCVELEPEAISEEFARLSGDYAYWNERYAAANKVHLAAEWAEEKIHAQLYLRFKEPHDGRKPPTEASVDAAVKLDPGYEEAHLAALAALHERDYLRGVLEALRVKKDAAVSLGSHLRQEMAGDVRLRERAAMSRLEDKGL